MKLSPVACFLIVFDVVIVAGLLYPVRGGSHPGVTMCLSQVKQMTLGALMYRNDYDDTLPEAGRWMDLTAPFVTNQNIYHDTLSLPKDQFGYSYRDQASNRKTSTIKNEKGFALVFDSTLQGRNTHSELKTLPSPGRHNGANSIGYLDGHAKRLLDPIEVKP